MIAFDTETTSIDQMSAELVGMSPWPIDGERGYYLPVGHRVAGAGEQGQVDMFAEPVGDQLPLDTGNRSAARPDGKRGHTQNRA